MGASRRRMVLMMSWVGLPLAPTSRSNGRLARTRPFSTARASSKTTVACATASPTTTRVTTVSTGRKDRFWSATRSASMVRKAQELFAVSAQPYRSAATRCDRGWPPGGWYCWWPPSGTGARARPHAFQDRHVLSVHRPGARLEHWPTPWQPPLFAAHLYLRPAASAAGELPGRGRAGARAPYHGAYGVALYRTRPARDEHYRAH